MALLLGGCAASNNGAPASSVSRTVPVAAAGPVANVPSSPKPPPFAFDVAEEAGVDRHCLRDVITAPLLTRNGNPAIAVSIDGVSGAAYLSFSESVLGLYASRALPPRGIGSIAVDSISRRGRLSLVAIRQVAFGQGVASNVIGTSLGAVRDERIAGEKPLAVLGYDFLRDFDVLLDMPRQRVLMFQPTGDRGCPFPAARIPASRRVRLVEDGHGQWNAVPARLDGHAVTFLLEPAADGAIVGRSDARAADRDATVAGADDPVVTEATGLMLGSRHRFRSLSIGDWNQAGFAANVEPARYNVLGRSFFRHREVLIGFASHVLLFSDEHADLLPVDTARAERGPISSRLAIVHVQGDPVRPAP